MIKLAPVVTAAVIPLLGFLALTSSSPPASASSKDCAPSVSCGTFTGTDSAGHSVSLDAKWQGVERDGRATDVIGYGDYRGDRATSFALVAHRTTSGLAYSIVYAPHNRWTSRCVTAGRGGLLELEPCSNGTDLRQLFWAFAVSSSRGSRGSYGSRGGYGMAASARPSAVTAGQSYLLENCATHQFVRDSSTAQPGIEQWGGDTRQLCANGGQYGRVYGGADMTWTWSR